MSDLIWWVGGWVLVVAGVLWVARMVTRGGEGVKTATEIREALAGPVLHPGSHDYRLVREAARAYADLLDQDHIPMMRVSALANEWVVCSTEDADVVVVVLEGESL